jgi:hypothetical protein
VDNEKAQSLSVEYALTRGELIRSYLRSLAESAKFRRTIVLYSIGFGVFNLLLNAILARSIAPRDVIGAVACAVGLFVFFPVLIVIFAKTARRTLAISPEGVSTEIGRRAGKIPWNKISNLTETPAFVLIARTSGNAFFVPDRAFSGAEHRQHFVTEIRRWMSANSAA